MGTATAGYIHAVTPIHWSSQHTGWKSPPHDWASWLLAGGGAFFSSSSPLPLSFFSLNINKPGKYYLIITKRLTVYILNSPWWAGTNKREKMRAVKSLQ